MSDNTPRHKRTLVVIGVSLLVIVLAAGAYSILRYPKAVPRLPHKQLGTGNQYNLTYRLSSSQTASTATPLDAAVTQPATVPASNQPVDAPQASDSAPANTSQQSHPTVSRDTSAAQNITRHAQQTVNRVLSLPSKLL